MKRGNFFSILTIFVLLILFVVPMAYIFMSLGNGVDMGDPAIDVLVKLIPIIIPIILFVVFARYLVSK